MTYAENMRALVKSIDDLLNDIFTNNNRYYKDEFQRALAFRDTELIVAIAQALNSRVTDKATLQIAIEQMRIVAVESLYEQMNKEDKSRELLDYCFDRF